MGVIDVVMAADARYHGPHMPNGLGDRESWRRAISMYRAAFPDSHVTFEDFIVSGDFVVGRWRATGTHTGAMPGLPPTGKPIAVSGITIYRFVGRSDRGSLGTAGHARHVATARRRHSPSTSVVDLGRGARRVEGRRGSDGMIPDFAVEPSVAPGSSGPS